MVIIHPDPVATVAARQYGVIRNDQLTALGVSRSAISRRVGWGLIESPLPGVYRLAAGQTTWLQELMAACLWGDDSLPQDWPRKAGAVVSYEAAAALLGFDAFREGPVVVTTRRHVPPTSSAVVVHRATPDPRFTVMRQGIPVTNAPRTLIDLGRVLGRDALEASVDEGLRRGFTDRNWLQWTAEQVPGALGARRIFSILDGLRPLDGPSASAFQKDVRTFLLSGGLRVVEESVVRDASGEFVARVDFELEYGVEVEAQSAKYHASWEAQARDYRRHNRVTGQGKFVIYVTPKDMKERRREVLAEVQAAVRMARALREGGRPSAGD